MARHKITHNLYLSPEATRALAYLVEISGKGKSAVVEDLLLEAEAAHTPTHSSPQHNRVPVSATHPVTSNPKRSPSPVMNRPDPVSFRESLLSQKKK